MQFELKMQDFSSEMMAELVVISDFYFGENYFQNHIFPLFLKHKSSIKVAVISPNIIVGFAFGFILPFSKVSEIIRIPIPKSVRQDENVGILNTVVIHHQYLHQHLGKKLATELMASLRTEHINSWFAIAWKSNNHVAAEQLNFSLGFKTIGEQADYWLEDTLQKQYSCSICGDICHCSAVIYYLEHDKT